MPSLQTFNNALHGLLLQGHEIKVEDVEREEREEAVRARDPYRFRLY